MFHTYVHSASMKSYQYRTFDILENKNTALWLLLHSCFWSTTNCFGEIKQLHEPWIYGACEARVFYVFYSF